MVKEQGKVSIEDTELIQSFVQEMKERAGAEYFFDLKKSYLNQSYLELLTPKANYSKSYTPLNSLSCINAMRNRFTRLNIKKEDVWVSFRCQVTSSLPDNFFETPPYIHSSGNSYAYLAFKNLYNERGTAGRFLPYFHISELKLLKVELPPLQEFLTQLTGGELLKLINGDKFFMTSEYLLVNNGLLNYSVFSLKNINTFLRRNGYVMRSFDPISSCDYHIGDACINRASTSVINRFSETSYMIFGGALFILLITVLSLYNRIEKQSREEERKKHALRVLTHELRTPVASLLLQIDDLNENTQNLPPPLEEKLLRIEGDIYRLKYLAEKSRGYLQADSNSLIQFNNIELQSLNTFLKEAVEPLRDEDAQFHYEFGNDVSVYIDPYWVEMCLVNLITNAKKYGKPPITIRTSISEAQIEVMVIDQGELQVSSLKDLLKRPKSQSDQGLGIGLEIVQKTLKEMRGSLSLTTNPTCFKMKIMRSKKINEKNTIS